MKRSSYLRHKPMLAAFVATLALVSAAAWSQKTRLLAWYHVRGLSGASTADLDTWVHGTVTLDHAAVPALLDALRSEERQACVNVHTALAELAHRWGPHDDRTADLAAHLADAFPQLSAPGQAAALDVYDVLLRAKVPSASVLAALNRTLMQAAQASDAAVHERALNLAAVLVARESGPEALTACAALARACLHDVQATNRTQALQLAPRLGLDVIREAARLLDDQQPEVRRAAVRAVGPVPDAVAADDLLRGLHDADADVRRGCEEALRARGLRGEHIQLGRLLTDPQPGQRLRLVDRLLRAQDLEPGVWLRRLSHDPAPAVRAAAIRAAAEDQYVDLSDRLEQMTQTDPSSTVRQLARFYLTSRKADRSHPRNR
jgi:hypothetical protein